MTAMGGPDPSSAFPSVPSAAIPPRYRIRDLWIVRHGESRANAAFSAGADEAFPGSDSDVELTSTGYEQATRLGRWLAGLAPDRAPQLVVCSPYVRAQQTWATMARTADGITAGSGAVPAVTDERCRDREMGIFELHTPQAIRRRAPQEYERRARLGDWFYRPPGGESVADVALRMRDLLSELDRTTAERILIVAHDAVVVTAAHVLAGVGATPLDAPPPVPNASITQWRNDETHLRLAAWGLTPPGRDDAMPESDT
ncbi:2,3-bisphosphoglycerate-dependent phosphoglycerate mutase [Nocardia cerradoensis]|uniref:2,3-bisphosphoglycerate-dependent phosphoglycerate mutase n=1 Tax=Nocardia cerradoensis TaxID=85688 RepID=A0A231GVY9_9NOCA|nr:histidine phosphatase family protein [Nocardia cerradoensis]OXR40766.1 2,3-bisphosphoglycerate-dependent phosphoglycerate mutase [Nocardia cerradoensis]